ncbi:pilus assembly PilX N-terminal domain-containing protein [Psychromonas sp. MME2]|uniref:pilus assembly PilX N-terminal domain-containing protein n=1 Tax=unclassified Psychromonas TaxID=2614957 RepID=UPI00339CE327
MKFIKHQRGFAVLITALLLCLAGIAFTTNMAFSQLIDNQIAGNYYRNREAFLNAESGINLMLSKITASASLLNTLPISYHPAGASYSVSVERINKNSVALSAVGMSQDGTAQREIHLQINHELTYNIPLAALSVNGKLHLNDDVVINDGCEGVNASLCKSPGNIAKYQLVTHPSNETQATAECTGHSLAQNVFASNLLHGDNFLTVGEQKSVIDEYGFATLETVNWPENRTAAMQFHGLEVTEDVSPSSLFESTFGVSESDAMFALQSANDVAMIDMNDGDVTNCLTRLTEVDEAVSTIYIEGDCDLMRDDLYALDAEKTQRVSIGSVDNPKLLLIKGGHFVSEAKTDVVIFGMVYFLPGSGELFDENGNVIVDPDTEQVMQAREQSVDLGNLSVNGAVLSEYNCSYSGSDNAEASLNAAPLSVRYDKTVLNKLYQNRGSLAVSAGYRVVAGSWKDFK